MSHFNGTLNGSRGEATRCGDKNSGLTAVAASYGGAVEVYVYRDKYALPEGQDRVRIGFRQWVNGAGRNLILYDGPVNPSNEEIFAAMVKHAPAALGVKE